VPLLAPIFLLINALAGSREVPATPARVIPPADTLYALAVDSTKYPRESFIYLLDDGVLRFEADGRGSRTYRQVIQILKEDAVEQWAELKFSFEPSHQKLTVNWAKVVTTAGVVISDKPGISQDADVPAPMGNPSYVEQKVRRLSMPNVRPGTIVDYSYTLEELRPYRAGDFFAPWRVNPGLLVRRSRLLLDTPVGLEPKVVAKNLDFAPRTIVAGGRRVVTWATQDVPGVEPELFAADSNGVDMSINVSAPSSWGDIGSWYAGLARDRYAITPSVERKLKAVVSGSRTLEDSIRAIHKYVSQDVRYVAISLGMGGYQPRSATDVVATGYGDCKDKATLFITMAARLGVTAYPVLLAAGGRVERGLPTISQFNHAIAAVERPSGRVFVDLTAGDVPWGSLPAADQGQFVLVVRPDGRTEETTTPEEDEVGSDSRIALRASLDTAGFATAWVEMSLSGASGDAMRAALERDPMDSTARVQYLRRAASSVYQESEGDSLRFDDETGSGGPFRIRFMARNGRAAQLAGTAAILTLPFLGQAGDVKPLVAELRGRTPRRFPIDAAQVGGASGGEVVLTLTLPEGWRAQLPKNVALSGPFGALNLTYAQQGRVLTVNQRRVGGKGILPPDRVEDVVKWLQQVSTAMREASSIVVIRG
jgi:transglutaminase-like putative cysteine protease